MKKMLFGLFLFVISSFTLNAENLKLKIGTGEWIPLTGEKMEGQGIATEILKEAFSEEGIDVEIAFFPWKRCQFMLEENQLDGIFPYTRNDERISKFNYSQGLINVKTVFFYLEKKIEKLKFEKYEDLKEYRIGGVLGYWYEETLNKAGLSLDLVASDEQNIKKLLAGRIDVAIMTDIGGWYLIQNQFPDYLKQFKTTDYNLPWQKLNDKESVSCLIVSKKNTNGSEIIDKFNKGLNKIKKNGKYQKIMDKYEIITPAIKNR